MYLKNEGLVELGDGAQAYGIFVDRDVGIQGRSKMVKKELIHALRNN